MLKTIWKFITYWYFRYSLITEFYMVEKWETLMMHIALFVVFAAIATVNWKIASYILYNLKDIATNAVHYDVQTSL